MLDPMNLSENTALWWNKLLSFWREREGLSTPVADSYRLTGEEKYQLSKVLQGLSRGLTGERSLAGESYMKGAGLGAYLLYFWPVSFTQLQWIWHLVPFRQKRRVLDLASGPGPLALAALEAGAGEVWASDPSIPALALAKDLARSQGWTLHTHPWSAGESLPPGPWDIITLGHGLNEVGVNLPDKVGFRASVIQSAIDSLSPQGRLYWMEPASTGVNREMLAVRDELLLRGMKPLAPCLWESTCPALGESGGTCHASFSWTPPRGFEALAWAARLGKEELKMTWFVYGPRSEIIQKPAGRIFRVVGDFLINKAGRKRIYLCGTEGRLSLSAIQAKGETWRSSFEDLKRGDLIRVTDPETRESGLGLLETSRLEVVKKAYREPVKEIPRYAKKIGYRPRS